MMMINKKVLTTTVAASVLVGGAVIGLLQTDAFADTATDAPAASSKPADPGAKGKPGMGDKRHMGSVQQKQKGFGEGNLLKETAAILGSEEKDLVEKLKGGQSLAEIAQAAGVSEADFLAKLTDAVSKEIDAALAAGKLTQEQADKAKAGIADKVKQSIAVKGLGIGRGPGGPGGPDRPGGPGKGGAGQVFGGGPGHPGGPGQGFGGFAGPMAQGLLGKEDALVKILGITKDELMTALKAGKSIAEIAQEKGISEDDLISKLKDAMTDSLKQFVERKPQEKPQLQDRQRQELPMQQRGNLRQRGPGNGEQQQPADANQQGAIKQKFAPKGSAPVSNT